MYPLIRINKRAPDGVIWQARCEYRLPPVEGWTRVYGPAGTRWSNLLGGWTSQYEGMSMFHPDKPFTIACSGPADDKRLYIDIAHHVCVWPELVEFVDLFLDVMIDARGAVGEKDEHQLVLLPHAMRDFVRAARDDVRQRIAAGDPLFDPRSVYYALPPDVAALRALTDELDLD